MTAKELNIEQAIKSGEINEAIEYVKDELSHETKGYFILRSIEEDWG